MRKILFLFTLVFAVALLAVMLKSPRAEQVEHHGYLVNAMGRTTDCLACHDGTAAKSVSNCIGVNCLMSDSHPVDKPYPPPGKEEGYAPVDQVTATQIKLDEGKITCISCHDLKNPAPQHPAVNNDGSRLCLTCHLK